MVIRTAIDTNIRLSRATSRRLKIPPGDPVSDRFNLEIDRLIRALPDGATVLDLGGGRHCAYAQAVQPPGRVRLIAVDISAEEQLPTQM